MLDSSLYDFPFWPSIRFDIDCLEDTHFIAHVLIFDFFNLLPSAHQIFQSIYLFCITSLLPVDGCSVLVSLFSRVRLSHEASVIFMLFIRCAQVAQFFSYSPLEIAELV